MTFTQSFQTAHQHAADSGLDLVMPSPAQAPQPARMVGQQVARRPFRLRAYLPDAYLPTPRARRAGRYA